MTVFRHGVASGDPLADRVILWTRATSDRLRPVGLRWTVALDERLEDVVAEGEAETDGGRDWTVHVDADGLEPGTTYFYAFEALGERSPVARTRTLPAGECDHARFAFTSCAKYTAGWFNAYGRIADRDDLDFVLHLGDYIYEYPNDDGKAPAGEIGREADPPHECFTLEDYRRRYACFALDEDLRRLHHRHPIIATIDDHEICDNTWREDAKKHDPGEGDFLRRKAAALQAWQEWLPVRLTRTVDPIVVFREFQLGDLVDLVVLDGRTRRDEQTAGPERDIPDRTILGEEQHAWLLERLAASTAAWRILGNSVMIGQVFSELTVEELGDPLSELGVIARDDEGPAPDQWDGYPAARERLLRFLEETPVEDVVFLSGDVHTSWAVELRRDPQDEDAPPLAAEFVTPSVTSENLDEETALAEHVADVEVEQHLREMNPHVRWVDLDRHGFVVVDVTRERVQGDWWFVDTLRERSDGVELGASWLVRRGEPGLAEAREPAAQASSAS